MRSSEATNPLALTAVVVPPESLLPRHRPAGEVEGATFAALRVVPGAPGDGLAQTVVDA